MWPGSRSRKPVVDPSSAESNATASTRIQPNPQDNRNSARRPSAPADPTPSTGTWTHTQTTTLNDRDVPSASCSSVSWSVTLEAEEGISFHLQSSASLGHSDSQASADHAARSEEYVQSAGMPQDEPNISSQSPSSPYKRTFTVYRDTPEAFRDEMVFRQGQRNDEVSSQGTDQVQGVLREHPIASGTYDTSLFQNRQEPFQNRQDTFQNRPSAFQNRQNVFQNRQETFPNRQEMLSNRPEMFPNRQEMLPNRSEIISNRQEMLPNRSEMVPNRSEMLPNRLDMFSNRQEMFQNRQDAFASRQLAFPIRQEAFPNRQQVFHSRQDATQSRQDVFQNRQEAFLIPRLQQRQLFPGQRALQEDHNQYSGAVVYPSPKQHRNTPRGSKMYQGEGRQFQSESIPHHDDPLHLDDEQLQLHEGPLEYHDGSQLFGVDVGRPIQKISSQVQQGSSDQVIERIIYQGGTKDAAMIQKDATNQHTLILPSPASGSSPSCSPHENIRRGPNQGSCPATKTSIECVNLASDDSDGEDSIQRSSTAPVDQIENDDVILQSDFDLPPPTPGTGIMVSRVEEDSDQSAPEWCNSSTDIDLTFNTSNWNANQSSVRIDPVPSTSRWNPQYSPSEGAMPPRTPGWNISSSSLDLQKTSGWNFPAAEIEILPPRNTSVCAYEGSVPRANRRQSPVWFAMPQTSRGVTMEGGASHYDNIFPPPTPGHPEEITPPSPPDCDAQQDESRDMPPVVSICHDMPPPTPGVHEEQHDMPPPTPGWAMTEQSSQDSYAMDRGSYRSAGWNLPPPTPGGRDFTVSSDLLNISPSTSPPTVDLTSSQSSREARHSSSQVCDQPPSPEVVDLFSPDASQSLAVSPAASPYQEEQQRSSDCELNLSSTIVSFGAMASMDDAPYLTPLAVEPSRDLVTPPPLEDPSAPEQTSPSPAGSPTNGSPSPTGSPTHGSPSLAGSTTHGSLSPNGSPSLTGSPLPSSSACQSRSPTPTESHQQIQSPQQIGSRSLIRSPQHITDAQQTGSPEQLNNPSPTGNPQQVESPLPTGCPQQPESSPPTGSPQPTEIPQQIECHPLHESPLLTGSLSPSASPSGSPPLTNEKQHGRRGAAKRASCRPTRTLIANWDTSPPPGSPTSSASLASPPKKRASRGARSTGRGRGGRGSKTRKRKSNASDDEIQDETWGKTKKSKKGRKAKRKRDVGEEEGSSAAEEKSKKKSRRRRRTKETAEEDLEVLEMRDEYDNDDDDDDEDYVYAAAEIEKAVCGNLGGCGNEEENSVRNDTRDECQNEHKSVEQMRKEDTQTDDTASKKGSVIGESRVSLSGGVRENLNDGYGLRNSSLIDKELSSSSEFIIDAMPIEIKCGSQTYTLGPENPSFRVESAVKNTKDRTSPREGFNSQETRVQKVSNLLPSIYSQDTILHSIFSQDTVTGGTFSSQNTVLNDHMYGSQMSAHKESNETLSRNPVEMSSSSSLVASHNSLHMSETARESANNAVEDHRKPKAVGKSPKGGKTREKDGIKSQEAEGNKEPGEVEEGEVSGEEHNAEEEEEDEDDSPHEAARMRRRALAAAFIMQEAEEGDAADDDDDDWLDDGDGDEASEAAAAASAAEARRRKQRSESWRPLRAPSPSVSDILKRLRLGSSEDGASLARARAAVPRAEPDQQALLPGVTDPCLWMVQCCRSQERLSVLMLMRKALRYEAGSCVEQLRVHSVVYSGSAPRYVYIEALRKQHAQAAVHDVNPLRAGRYRAKQVPISEMPDVLKACRKVPLLRRGQWVRPRRGIYRDDIAEVVEVDPAEEYAVVRLLPRIDYSLLAPGGGLKPLSERTGPKRKRTPARRLDVDALRRAGVDVSAAAVTGEVLFNRDTYKDGYLVKRFPLKALSSARPTLEETQAFGVDPEAGLLLSEEPEPWLGPGDEVEIKEGGLEGLRGQVLEMHGDTVTLNVNDPRIEGPVICAAGELRKDFSVGDRVRVVAGSHRGATGLVVKSRYERVYITEDETNREIEALNRHVRLANNSAPAEPAGGLRWADMVTLRDGSVGMVERVEGTSVRVLDAQGRLRAVDARSALLRGPHVRSRPLLDCEQNEIRPRDAVEVVEGPRKGERGTVKGAYRGCAFIAGDSLGDGRLFVARATHLRLQGGASDRCRMFLRQLDPDAAAEAAASVGIRGATQPASPAPPDPRRRAAITAPPPTPPAVPALGPPPPPPLPNEASARRADFDTFDRGLRRDRSLLGAVVILTAGPYKGSVGTVRDASLASARVELYTPQQTIPVKREHLKVMEPPSSGVQQRRPRAAAGATASPTRPTPFPLGGFYGTTGSATPHAPASPRPLPTPGFGESPSSIPAGYRTPMWGVAATPMYDAGSRTPLPTPQSPAASAAVWEARTTPGSLDSSSPLSQGFLSLPLVYPPPTPVAPPAPLPLAWPVPGLAVAVATGPGVAEAATVRAVTRDGGVTMVMRSGTLVTLATTERVQPRLPGKGEACVVVGDGPLRGRRAVLANIDGADGVIRLENCLQMQLVPMAHLCRVADEEELSFHAVDTPL